jgi:hypothetical protein
MTRICCCMMKYKTLLFSFNADANHQFLFIALFQFFLIKTLLGSQKIGWKLFLFEVRNNKPPTHKNYTTENHTWVTAWCIRKFFAVYHQLGWLDVEVDAIYQKSLKSETFDTIMAGVGWMDYGASNISFHSYIISQ